MLKETETEETVVFFVTCLSLVAFQLGGGDGPFLAKPMLLCIAASITIVRYNYIGSHNSYLLTEIEILTKLSDKSRGVFRGGMVPCPPPP